MKNTDESNNQEKSLYYIDNDKYHKVENILIANYYKKLIKDSQKSPDHYVDYEPAYNVIHKELT